MDPQAPAGSLRIHATGPNRTCEAIGAPDAAIRLRTGPGMVWADYVVTDDDEARELLENQFHFHELAVEDALSNEERPSVTEFSDTLFAVLPTVIRQADGWEFVEVAFFLTRHGLVSVSRRPVPMVEQAYLRWVERGAKNGFDAADAFHMVTDAIVDAYFPILDEIEDRVDEIADRVFEGDVHQLRKILDQKRDLIEIRRRIGPLRDVLNALLRRDIDQIPDSLRPYFQDILDHVLRLMEITETNRDVLSNVLDAHSSAVSYQLNDLVKKLTVYSIALMAMALVAGIFGMNFEHMPELKWAYGYPFGLGVIVTAGLVVLLIGKRARWI